MDKISIIVPVFNGQEFIDRCICKLLSVKSDKEIIVVNDASTDNTKKILESYKDKIKVINFETNKGVSVARNEGIKQAKGKFVSFIDIDDDFDLNMFEIMLKNIKDADVCICNYKEYYNKSKKFVNSKYKFTDDIIEKNTAIKMMLCDELPPTPYGKLIKRELLNGEDFNPNLNVGEDILFCLQLATKCYKISLINQQLYTYIQNENSIMHSISQKLLQFCDVTKYIEREILDYILNNFPEEFAYFKTQMITRGIHSISTATTKQTKKQAIEMLKFYCTKQNLIDILKNKYTPKFVKMECWIIKHFGIKFHLFLMPIYKWLRNVKRK